MKTNHKLLVAVGVAAVVTLAGCSSNSAGQPANEVPNGAGVSTAAFVAYLLTLSASDESSEPLIITDAFSVPAEETADPTPLT